MFKLPTLSRVYPRQASSNSSALSSLALELDTVVDTSRVLTMRFLSTTVLKNIMVITRLVTKKDRAQVTSEKKAEELKLVWRDYTRERGDSVLCELGSQHLRAFTP